MHHFLDPLANILYLPLPMHRIRLPRGGVGRDYVLVQLTIDGVGPYDFMLDSGKLMQSVIVSTWGFT